MSTEGSVSLSTAGRSGGSMDTGPREGRVPLLDTMGHRCTTGRDRKDECGVRTPQGKCMGEAGPTRQQH